MRFLATTRQSVVLFVPVVFSVFFSILKRHVNLGKIPIFEYVSRGYIRYVQAANHPRGPVRFPPTGGPHGIIRTLTSSLARACAAWFEQGSSSTR